MPDRPSSIWVRLSIAIAAVAVAFLFRELLARYVGPGLPAYITFYPAVMFAAVVAGLVPGLTATAVSALVVAYWILPPHGRLEIQSTVDLAALVLFATMGGFMSGVAELYRRSRQRGAADQRELAVRESQNESCEVLQRLNQDLFQQNEALTRQSAHLSRQAGELAEQKEEPAAQAEELASQNEELQAQAEEIQALNVESKRRGELLQALLDAARLARSEQGAMHEICVAAMEMFGEAAALVVVFEKQGDALVTRALAGRAEVAAVPDSLLAPHNFAELIVEQNRTVSLNDTARRSDLQVLALPGQPPFLAVVGAPMRRGKDDAFGAVVVYSHEKQEWTAEQFSLADWLAAQSAHILEILRLQDDLRRQVALVDLSLDAIIVRQPDGTITLWGQGAESLYGWTKAEAVGATAYSLLKTRFLQPLDEINGELEGTGRWSGELIHSTRDGRDVVVQSRWLARRDAAGRIAEVLESNVDLTQRRRAEEMIRSAALFPEENPGPILRVASTGILLFANRAAAPLLDGWQCGLGGPVPDMVRQAVAKAFAGDASTEELLVASGTTDLSFVIVPVAGRQYVNLYGRDVTTRRQAEQALRESEGRYRLLFQNLLDGFAYCRMIFDEHGRPEDFVYVDVNTAFVRLTGLKDVVGRRVTEVIPGIRESNPEVFEVYGRVTVTGQPEELETFVGPLKIWLSISVYSPEPGHFVAVFDNITERRQAEEALREADRRKNEFIATLSHELRNPLAPIRYALEVIDGGGDRSEGSQPRQVIERQLAHLVHLVDDLLDVTRIASSKVRLRKQRVDLGTIVQQAAEAAEPDIERANHSLVVSLPADQVWLDADPDRLAQVVTNLLTNAARYTPPGGRISVTAAAVQGEVVVSVADTGIGLSAHDLTRVFEMFTQVGEPGHGGLGLGLSLVKGLVELHGGTVEARSDGLGKGSEFRIRLPRAQAGATAAVGGTLKAAAGSPRRILVVDDNADAADMMRTFLEIHGHQVRVAYDGVSALASVPEFKPEIGLFDIGLPGMNGYELARRVRDNPDSSAMYLIAVTGWGQEEDRQRARSNGFDAHLTKPADPDAIEQLIAHAADRFDH